MVSVRVLLVSAALAAVCLVAAPAPARSHEDGAGREAHAALLDALATGPVVDHVGHVTVLHLGDRTASLATFEVAQVDGDLSVRQGEVQLGRGQGRAYLADAGQLLQVGGVQPLPDRAELLSERYLVDRGASVRLDTGPAVPLTLTSRDDGVRREVLHLDEDTGLVVRRETFRGDGRLTRVVAYTDLDVTRSADGLGTPVADGREVIERSTSPEARAALLADGFDVPTHLPGGYRLVDAVRVRDTSWPTCHLVYSDGLYTVSVFQERGSLDRSALGDAHRVADADGGVRWRWRGTEPRRLVWAADGLTVTSLSDAPRDRLYEAIVAFPADPAPAWWERVWQGLTRWAAGATGG